MDKQFFAVFLRPSRADFATTMTDTERNTMIKHVAYWSELLKLGFIYAFGPVLDPKEVYGPGVVAVNDEAALKKLIENDPAGNINKYEYFPMKAVVPELAKTEI